MSSPTTREPSKRRSMVHQSTVEEQALSMMAEQAETNLSTSQAVLAEARIIRSQELARIRQETPEIIDEVDDGPVVLKTPAKSATVLNSSISVTDTAHRSVGDPKVHLTELETKYKKVMVSNAQLDNEKLMLQYQVGLLKDIIGDLTEDQAELKRNLRKHTTDLEKRNFDLRDANLKCTQLSENVRQRDELIKKNGLMLVSTDESNLDTTSTGEGSATTALLSAECADILDQYEGKTLGDRLKKLFDDKLSLTEENRRLQNALEMEQSRLELAQKYQSPVDGLTVGTPDGPQLDVETQKTFTELKFKLKRAEQEITTLQGSVTRLESQANRYKASSESAELAGEQLKQDKKLLRNELRETNKKMEDLATENGHLVRRLERAKLAKNSSDAN